MLAPHTPSGEDCRPTAEPVGAPDELIELAWRLGIVRSTVYDNSGTFGAIRLGFGPHAPLRFDWAAVLVALPKTGPRRTVPPQIPPPTDTRAGTRLIESRPRFAPEGEQGSGYL